MTVFSYDKAQTQKRYLWTSLNAAVVPEGFFAHFFWPLLFLLCATIVVSLSAYVFFSVAQTDLAFDIEDAENNVRALSSANAELKLQLSEMTSPTRLGEIAKERGLVKIQNPIYITATH